MKFPRKATCSALQGAQSALRTPPPPRKTCVALALACLLVPVAGQSTDLDISKVPLDFVGAIEPNFMLMYDNSGSMLSGHTPDTLGVGGPWIGVGGTMRPLMLAHPEHGLWPPYLFTAGFNSQYYDPSKTYRPPMNAEGLPLTYPGDPLPGGNAAFKGAWHDGFRPDRNTSTSTRTNTGHLSSRTNLINLSNSYLFNGYSSPTSWGSTFSGGAFYEVDEDGHTKIAADSEADYPIPGNELNRHANGMPAYYYIYLNRSDCPKPLRVHTDHTTTGFASLDAFAKTCFLRRIVSETSGIDRGDGSGRDERQNFANWYSFHRTRDIMARTAISRAFAKFGSNVRVGFGLFEVPGRTYWSPETEASWEYQEGVYSEQKTQFHPDVIDGKSVRHIVPEIVKNYGGGTDSFPVNRSGGVRPFKDFTTNESGVYQGKKFRTGFYNWLFSLQEYGGTPTRGSLDGAGQYFENDSSIGPWSDTPGYNAGTRLQACRRSYTLLVTDGMIANLELPTQAAGGNVDGSVQTTIPANARGQGPYTYNGSESPFADTKNGSIADVAMYYWVRDLLPNVENLVPTTPGNPAYWQHMTTFAIGMGVHTRLNKDAVKHALEDPSVSIQWPKSNATSGTNAAKVEGVAPHLAHLQAIDTVGDYRIDELLHAAVNSRGDYFSADDPTQLEAALDSIVTQINNDTSSGSKPATPPRMPPGEPQTNAQAYTVTFDSEYWSSKIIARIPCTATDVGSVPGCTKVGEFEKEKWNSDTSTRNDTFVTWDKDNSAAISFKWSSLSDSMRAQLKYDPAHPTNSWLNNGQEVLEYLRGKTEHEEDSPGYRARGKHRLGDITTGDPLFVGRQNDGWTLETALTEADQNAYRAWKNSTAYKTRPEMLYVGANDGMLHGFYTTNGEWRVAYVPGNVFPKLKNLADPAYGHEFYADSSLVSSDARLGADWKNVLVGSTGAGGRAWYALDITNPASFGTGSVKWEFTHDELGVNATAGTATVVRLQNGTWAAVFGNGYNSKSHKAQLFIVNLASGALIRTIDTGVGSAADPNGLAAPRVFDPDQNGNVEWAYAGDVQGNLWRFNLNTGAFSKLLEAKDKDGKPQPITARPLLVKKATASQPGTLVYVGTGKLFGSDDPYNKQVQTLYGVLDEGPGTTTTYKRADLQQQSIIPAATTTDVGSVSDVEAYDTTANEVNYITKHGFYLDLQIKDKAAEGWRVLAEPQFHALSKTEGTVEFAIRSLSKDPCVAKVEGFVTELSTLSGAKPQKATFLHEANFAKLGMGKTTFRIGGKGNWIPASSSLFRPCVGENCDGVQSKDCGGNYYIPTASGEMSNVKSHLGEGNSCQKGRQSWRQLR